MDTWSKVAKERFRAATRYASSIIKLNMGKWESEMNGRAHAECEDPKEAWILVDFRFRLPGSRLSDCELRIEFDDVDELLTHRVETCVQISRMGDSVDEEAFFEMLTELFRTAESIREAFTQMIDNEPHHPKKLEAQERRDELNWNLYRKAADIGLNARHKASLALAEFRGPDGTASTTSRLFDWDYKDIKLLKELDEYFVVHRAKDGMREVELTDLGRDACNAPFEFERVCKEIDESE